MKTKKEIIEETVAYYSENINRRAFSLNGGCSYIDKKGRMCAVGRCAVAPKDLEVLSIRNKFGGVINLFSHRKIDPYLKKEYQGHDLEFWDAIQTLHDISSHWSKTGLSKSGEKYVERIITQFANQ